MSEIEKRTSFDWYMKEMEENDVAIVDPTGWDKDDLDHSFYQEEITLGEFKDRLYNSKYTYIYKKSKSEYGWKWWIPVYGPLKAMYMFMTGRHFPDSLRFPILHGIYSAANIVLIVHIIQLIIR